MTVRLGLVGLGKWGRIIAATVQSMDGVGLSAAVGKSPKPRPWLPDRTRVFDTWEDLLHSDVVDGLILATPPGPRQTIAEACLKAGMPVYLEKPIALSSETAETLFRLSEDTNTPFQAGHLHLHAPSYQAVKNALPDRSAIREIRSRGGNKGPFRDDYRALFDYGPHDVSMVCDLMDSAPHSVQARRLKGSDDPNAEIIEATLQFNTCTATITVGNLFDEKLRLLEVETQEGCYRYDDLSEVKAVFVRGGTVTDLPAQGPLPLTAALRDFATLASAGRHQSSAERWQSVRTTRVLDAIAQSITINSSVPVSDEFTPNH